MFALFRYVLLAMCLTLLSPGSGFAAKTCNNIFGSPGKEGDVFDRYRDLKPLDRLVENDQDVSDLAKVVDSLEPQFQSLVELFKSVQAGEISADNAKSIVEDFLNTAGITYSEVLNKASANSKADLVRQEALRSLLNNIDQLQSYLNKVSEQEKQSEENLEASENNSSDNLQDKSKERPKDISEEELEEKPDTEIPELSSDLLKNKEENIDKDTDKNNDEQESGENISEKDKEDNSTDRSIERDFEDKPSAEEDSGGNKESEASESKNSEDGDAEANEGGADKAVEKENSGSQEDQKQASENEISQNKEDSQNSDSQNEKESKESDAEEGTESGRESESAEAEKGKGSESEEAEEGKGSESAEAEEGKGSESAEAEEGKGSESAEAEEGKGSESAEAEAGKGSESGESKEGKGSEAGESESDGDTQSGSDGQSSNEKGGNSAGKSGDSFVKDLESTIKDFLKENLESLLDEKNDIEPVKTQREQLQDLLKKEVEEGSSTENKELEAQKESEDAKSGDQKSETKNNSDEKQNESNESEQKKEVKPRKRDQEVKSDFDSIDSKETTNIINQVIKSLWITILKNYDNSELTQAELNRFIHLMDEYISMNRLEIAKAYSERAKLSRDSVYKLGVKFNRLKEVAFSIAENQITDSGTNTSRLLRYLNVLLKELETVEGLSSEERVLLELTQKHFSKSSKKQFNNSLAKAFVDNLSGPAALKKIEAEYGDLNSKDGIDWERLSRDIVKGELNDLLLMSNLTEHLDFHYNPSMNPKIFEQYIGQKDPNSDSEKDVFNADDLNNWKNFNHEGNPAFISLIKFITEQMTENSHREATEYSDPILPQKKKVTIILSDVSSSMGTDRRFLIRNAIAGAFTDHAQKMSIIERSDHVMYYIPFEKTPGDPEILRTPSDYNEFFDRVLTYPSGSGGSTNIQKAILKAFELIKENQDNGGELARANILLLTDGTDPINREVLLKTREQISKDTEINLNTITIGQDEKALDFALNGGEKDKSKYFHISSRKIDEFLNTENLIAPLKASAEFYSDDAFSKVGAEKTRNLRDILLKIDREKESVSDVSHNYADQLKQSQRLNISIDAVNKYSSTRDLLMQFIDSPNLREMDLAKKIVVLETLENAIEKNNGQFIELLATLSDEQIYSFKKWIQITNED